MASISKNGKLGSSRLYSTQSGKIGSNTVNSYLKVNPTQSLNNKDGFVQSQRSEEISAIKARIQQLPDVDTEKIKHVQQSMGSYYSDGTEQYQNKYSNTKMNPTQSWYYSLVIAI